MLGLNKGASPARPGGAPMTSPIPPPRPAGPGAAAKPSAPGFSLFPNMPIQQRYDMAMEMLKNGMAMAAQSNSPVAAFLAPLAGAAIGGGIESKFGKIREAENADLMAALMPGGVPPEAQRLMAILDNPDTPEYAKSMAKARLDALLAPAKGVVGGPAAAKPYKGWAERGYGNSDALLTAMFVDARNPESPGGATVTPQEKADIEAAMLLRRRGSDSTMTYDAGDAGLGADNDPLGIR